jgi:hypothetical protein
MATATVKGVSPVRDKEAEKLSTDSAHPRKNEREILSNQRAAARMIRCGNASYSLLGEGKKERA